MKNSSNTVQAFWVAIGSFSAFAVSIVSTMILSRYFDKTDYGTYRQVLYVYQTLLVVFTVGLPKAYAYFLPRVEIKYAKSLINKVTNIFYILGVIFSVLLFVFSPIIADVLKNPDLEVALRIFSPVPLFLLPTMGIEGVFASFQKNKYMAVYNLLTKSLILLCASLPVICFSGTYKDALIGFTIASFISFLVANYLKHWCVKTSANETTTVTYKEILKFSMPLFYASIWGVVAISADKFFISRYFGAEVFADFSNGSLQLPFVGMIIGACSTVLMPLFSKKTFESNNPQRDILPIWTNVLEKTIKLTYPMVLFFIFFADQVMDLLYGSKYIDSGIYFAIMLFANFFTIIAYFPTMVAIGASKYYSRYQAYGAVFTVILCYLSIVTIDSPYVITVVSVLRTVFIAYLMLRYIAKYFSIKFTELLPLKLASKIAVPSFFILFGIRFLGECLYPANSSLLLKLLLYIFVYGVLYLMWCRIAHIDYLSIIKPLLSKVIKKPSKT